MGTTPRVGPLVRRLEASIATLVSNRESAVLAYSGGLASTLIAMIARKRCDLRCVVAGVEGSPDVEAAKLAKSYLDYRVEFVSLEGREARSLDERLAAEDPRLSASDREALIPVCAVLAQAVEGPILAGFGVPRIGTALASALEGRGVVLPLRTTEGRGTWPRAALQDATLALGLPSDWAHVRHRSPAIGAGLRDLLSRDRDGVRW